MSVEYFKNNSLQWKSNISVISKWYEDITRFKNIHNLCHVVKETLFNCHCINAFTTLQLKYYNKQKNIQETDSHRK